MPNYDGTGPKGEGPMTGCGQGYCILPISTPEEELVFLQNQARALQTHLRQIKSRIKILKTKENIINKKEVHYARI